MHNLELNVVIEKPHFLARLECGQTNVRAAIASERITEGTVSAAAHLALDGKVYFGKVLGLEFHGVEGFVGSFTLLSIFFLNLLRKAAGTVFAGAPPLADLGTAFWRCVTISNSPCASCRNVSLTRHDRPHLVLLCQQLILVNQVVIVILVFTSNDWSSKIVAKVYKADTGRLRRLD